MRPVRLGRYAGGVGRTADRTCAAPQEPVTHRGVTGIWGRPLVENGVGVSRERPGFPSFGADQSLIGGLPRVRAA